MKKLDGRKKLALSRETLRVLEPDSLQKVGGGIPTIVIVIVVTTTTLLGGDTPQ